MASKQTTQTVRVGIEFVQATNSYEKMIKEIQAALTWEARWVSHQKLL